MVVCQVLRWLVLLAAAGLAVYAAEQYGRGVDGGALWLCLSFACACLLLLAGANERFDSVFPEARRR